MSIYCESRVKNVAYIATTKQRRCLKVIEMQRDISLRGRSCEPYEYHSKQQLAFPYLKYRFLEIPFEIRNSRIYDIKSNIRYQLAYQKIDYEMVAYQEGP
jgi:hypothetical protein